MLFMSGSRFLECLSPTLQPSLTHESELDNADLEIEESLPFLLHGLTKDDLHIIGWQRDHDDHALPEKTDLVVAKVSP